MNSISLLIISLFICLDFLFLYDLDLVGCTFPGGGNGNTFQYSCLKNSMDRGSWGLQSTELQRVGHE